MLYEQKFLLSLILTLTIELPIIFILVRYVYKYRQIEISRILFVGFIASALTLPYLWFILPVYFRDRSAYIMVGESFAIIAEAIIYNRLLNLKLFESFKVSLAANIVSVILGTLF